MSSPSDPIVLSIDIGGSHVKILSSAGGEERRVVSGATMTATQMVDAVKALAAGWSYDVISVGYPGPVVANKPTRDPAHLGPGWAGHDFATSFDKPVKVVNDALMQAIGSYEGGRMLFVGLGTGLGTAMVVENVGHPLEVGHLPYRKDKTFEDFVGEPYLERHGKRKWREQVFLVVSILGATMLPSYIVIGGGNVEKLGELPLNCRRGDNARAFTGGFRLWLNKTLVI